MQTKTVNEQGAYIYIHSHNTNDYDYKDNDYTLSSSTSNKPSGTNIFLEHSISKEYSGFLSSGISFEEKLKNETPITLFSPESESKDILDNSLSSCHILESETEPDFNNMPIIEIRNIMLSYGLKIGMFNLVVYTNK